MAGSWPQFSFVNLPTPPQAPLRGWLAGRQPNSTTLGSAAEEPQESPNWPPPDSEVAEAWGSPNSMRQDLEPVTEQS